MKDLISIAILIATVFSSTVANEKIFKSDRDPVLTKAAHGLSGLLLFANSLSSKKHRKELSHKEK